VPTSATHITVVQRVASHSPQLTDVLGDPDPSLSEDDGAARKMRYASLGSVGPDFLYAALDYRGRVQDLENFLVKVAGSIACLSQLQEELGAYVTGVENELTGGVAEELKKTCAEIGAIFKLLVESIVVNTGGLNLWALFLPRRQEDKPRTEWFWADYLHYVRTGRFVRNLIELAGDDENLRAYACGYLTHYVTDVVGHPYVNQVVQGPWRLGWQRHHLVENFIDAYVWPRWHTALPKEEGAVEAPLDRLEGAANGAGAGAPVTEARLHDHITIGSAGLGDPVDGIVETVCKAIRAGTFVIGAVEEVEPEDPHTAELDAWADYIVRALRNTYEGGVVPENLQGDGRADGFLTADDVKAAYGVFRLVLKMATEEGVREPEPYDVPAEAEKAVSDAFDKAQSDIEEATRPDPDEPASPNHSFSLEDLFAGLIDAFEDAVEAAAKFVKGCWDAITDLLEGAGNAVTTPIKALLVAIQRALFGLYRDFRRILVLQGYLIPLQDEVSTAWDALDTETLWRAVNSPETLRAFPHEEDAAAQRPILGSHYRPELRPTTALEQPALLDAGPYPRAHPFERDASLLATLPDDFIDAPLGPDDLFSGDGPVAYDAGAASFGGSRNFGGAIENCVKGITLALAGFPDQALLPDYNLDGDRGYAWPCWDVERGPDGAPTTPLDSRNRPAGASVRVVPLN
jgi:Zinc dependent phospholipase C